MKTVAVIGLGSIGMRHAKNLKALGCHVWGYDPDMSKRLEHGFDLCGSQIKDLITADAFVIASPTQLHSMHIGDTRGAHKPCFCEKPIAYEIDNLYLDYVSMVGYNLRFHSCVKKAKEWLDNDLIGVPLWAEFCAAQYTNKPPYLRDGVILNWSHEIDLALYLIGEATVAGSSTRLTDGKDDLTDIQLTHKNNCHSTIHLDYLTKPEIRCFTIVGNLGTINCNLVGREITLTEPSGVLVNYFKGEDSWDKNYIEEMQAFLDRIDGKKTLGATGEDGLQTLEICLEVRKQAGLS